MVSKKTAFLLLFLLTVFGLILRLRWWPNYLTFGFEQARDAIAAKEIIVQKKISLIGPTSEIEGIFHGPIYYYLIGPVYFLFGNNPANVGLLHILINLTTIPIIYFIGQKIFNRRVGLISAAIFAVSYEVISYSIWLSNPSPALPLILLTYYFFYLSFTKNQKYLPLASFLLSLSTSFDLIIVMNIFAVISLYFVYNKKLIKLKTWILTVIAFIVPLITYPIFELRHNFLMTNKFFEVLKGQDSSFKSIFEYLIVYLNGLAKEFANILFPIHGFFAGILMFVFLLFLYRKICSSKSTKNPFKLIAIWIFSTLPVFLIIAAVTNSEFSFFGVDAAISILAAVIINELLDRKKFKLAIFILAIIVLGNLKASNSYFKDYQRKLFDSQRGVYLKDIISTVDYTYQQSKGEAFFIDAVTVPLYVSRLWDYLYSWHGQEKFGYLPTKDNKTQSQFLIIEPGAGLTYDIFKQKAIDHMNQSTKIEEIKSFGVLTIEKRSLINNK